MPWRLRSSMTMSKKSIESSWSWARRRTSGFKWLRSSSGAMSAMISSTTCLTWSLVIAKAFGRSGHESFNDERRIDAQHTERIVQNSVNSFCLHRSVKDQTRQRALRVQIVDIDRRMHHQINERRQISRQLESSRSAHCMPDEALGVINVRVGTVHEHAAQRLTFLNIAERCGGRVCIDDVDILRSESGVCDGFADALGLSGRIGKDVIARVRVDAVFGFFGVFFF